MIINLNFSLRQRIKLGINNTVFGLSGTVFNFIFSIIIVRMFSTDLWGSFTQSMLIITLFNLITGWGNKDFLIRQFSKNPKITYYWQTSFISRTIIFVPLIPILLVIKPETMNYLLLLMWVMINFILRSFDSVIAFERKFKEAIGVEIIGFITIILSLLIFRNTIGINILMFLFIGSSILKIIFYSLIFKKILFVRSEAKFRWNEIVVCLPYFLPPFIGFLQAKSDTFAVALQLSGKELGEYYVLLSLLSYCHATAVLAITPFLKNIYRINSGALLKIRKTFILLGMIWSVVCIVIIYTMLTYIYKIEFTAFTYLIAWLTLPPYFFYYLLMQDFLRQDRPYPIVIINLIAAGLNFATSLLLIRYYGFTGGLISCSLMQWMLLLGFIVAHQLRSPKIQAA